MKYKTLLFDFDNTLLDFETSSEIALRKTFTHFDIPKDFIEGVLEKYKEYGADLWKKFERGDADINAIKYFRFEKVKEIFKFDHLDVVTVGDYYFGELEVAIVYEPNVIEVCKELSKRYQLGIITNGVHHLQDIRLNNSELVEFFDFMVTSDTAGAPKPDAKIFEKSLDHCHTDDVSKVLVIGDNTHADIWGAKQFGMDACYYNPKKEEVEFETQPDYHINDLTELLGLL